MTQAKRVSFDWQDPMFLEHQLNDEERMIRDAAREYCQDSLMSRVKMANRNEVFDREIMNEFGNWGCWVRLFRKSMAVRVPTMCPTAWWRAKWSASIAVTARQ